MHISLHFCLFFLTEGSVWGSGELKPVQISLLFVCFVFEPKSDYVALDGQVVLEFMELCLPLLYFFWN